MKCKTVKERFLECNMDEFMKEFFLFFNREDRLVPTEEHYKRFRELIDGIRKITPLKSDEVINAEIYNISSDIKGDNEEVSLAINDKGIDLKEIDVYVTEPDSDEKYSFMLTEWERSLGYLVPDFLVQKFGLETLMAAVLYEMTWFGTSAEEVHEQIKVTADALEEVQEGGNEKIGT